MAKRELGNRKREHKCKFCKKGFSTERTLASHLCEKKKRFNDRETIGARIGLAVFQRFYELTTSGTRTKSVEDFINSAYYMDFIKFGRYIAMVKPVNTDMFIDYVIKNGIKLRDWTKQKTYEAYIVEMLLIEPAERALERTIINLSEWCENENIDLQDFYSVVTPNEATMLVQLGKISPWLLYVSEKADILFDKFNTEQYAIIQSVIDPNKWKAKLTKNRDDVDFVQSILEAAGL